MRLTNKVWGVNLWCRALVAVLVVFGTACAVLDKPDIQPVKSPADSRDYRYLKLANGMPVLLISDPASPKAAAALDVHVGSADNPPGRGGLAHFLEHMLFLGTEKYPDSGEYERYISEHGGSRNAYTSFEHTNYFFDIDAEYLAGGLDRFAQFFIAPTFDVDYVAREKNAVQAEYQMGMKNDGRRGLDVLQTLMNRSHPYSQFSVGSLDTLADKPNSPVRDELLAFYHKYYAASRMRLVVYGAQSLDALQALVEPLFSQVADSPLQREPITQPLFAADTLPLLVTVQPQATLRQLEVNFPIADYRDDYTVKPAQYVGGLVGHEGVGSLLSVLKKRGLAEALSTGTGLGWNGGSLFSVSISLSEKGVKNYQEVLQLLFQYLAMLRSQGPDEAIYNEQSRLAALDFQFEEKVAPLARVTALAARMHDFSARDILRGPYHMVDYQPSLLTEMLDALRADNAEVVLTAAGVSVDGQTPYYNVPYRAEKVLPQQLAHWREPVAGVNFGLPRPNPFVADDVSLLPPQKDQQDSLLQVMDTARQKLWYRQSETFLVPRGAMYVNFQSPKANASVVNTALAMLYVAMLKDAVNEYAYEAQLAGLGFDLYRHAQGISLRVSGYTDKQQVLLQALVEDIQHIKLDERRFDNIRHDLIRQLHNRKAQRPASQVMVDVREALLPGTWSETALAAALASVDRKQLGAFAQAFWRSAQSRMLVYGNYSLDDAKAMAAIVKPLLTGANAAVMESLPVVKLSPGQALLYPVSVEHGDTVVAWYLQAQGDSWRDRAATALTAKMMESGFFQELRTEQQLGYIVSAFYYPQRDVPGLMMLVQSPVASATGVVEAMERFFEQVPSSISIEQFERNKAALIGEIMEPDKNLWERAEFYWQALARGDEWFESREKMMSSVMELNYSKWKAYVEQVFKKNARSLRVVAPGSTGQLPSLKKSQRVNSADALHRVTGRYLISVP